VSNSKQPEAALNLPGGFGSAKVLLDSQGATMTHPALLRANPYLDPLIERLALESELASSLEADRTGRWLVTDSGTINSQIAAFAALVAEECAKVADAVFDVGADPPNEVAAAIRARFVHSPKP
jgi:hypothetical protein